jgi:hypothetical protein
MKRDENNELSFFEARIARELKAVEDEIRKLQAEALVLRRQLGKAQAERLGLQHATRKNSMDRVLVENSVIEQLRETSPLSTAVLLRKARSSVPELKDNTFRTYLYRMKKRGLIRTARKVGEWQLPPPPAPSPSALESIVVSLLRSKKQ